LEFGYPRPQLERPAWTSLNGPWRFQFDNERRYENPSEIAAWPAENTVPYPPESQASGIGDRRLNSSCWYERDFEVPFGEQRVVLHFGAVDYSARVWVNGALAVEHEGGHTPFSADITNMLRRSGRQTVTVQVVDDPADLAKPRGKQDWQAEPHAIWYPRTTGIWQTVWLEVVSKTYVESIRWTPNVENFALRFEAFIGGDSAEDLSIDIALRLGTRLLAHDRYRVVDRDIDRQIALSDPGIDDFRNELLWSPERPTLLEAKIRLYRGDELIDEFASYTALRTVGILRDRFMLNGRPYLLRMVLDQGYWPDTLLAAPNDAALKKDVELAKEMGFNGVRKHQKVEDPRYLYWADRLGLLVWEEMPSAYRFTRTAVKRTVKEWTEVIARDYSHPCIIVWVPFNESWGVPELTGVGEQRHAVQALYHLTKTLDSSRPVIGNDGWESSATDIIGIHDYDANTDHLRARYGAEIAPEQLFDRRRPGGRVLTLDGYPHRGQPIMLTEFGGVAFRSKVEKDVPTIWGYSTVLDEASFGKVFDQLMQTVIHTQLFSGFCYTQFADTFQESNGLLNADRSPKLPLAQIRKSTGGSRNHIACGV
jgi:beta-galactosidase/beta-glucuronidase